MKGGSPPTARNARTGELTPPGIICSARLWSLRDWSNLRAMGPPRNQNNHISGESRSGGCDHRDCDREHRPTSATGNVGGGLKHPELSLFSYVTLLTGR